MVANVGVMFEYKDTINAILEDLAVAMNQGRGAFSNCNYLIFTHEHPDHFSVSVLKEYLKKMLSKGLLSRI